MADVKPAARDPDATVRTAPPAAEPSLAELVRQLAQDSGALVRQEIALAKAEVGETVSRAVLDAARIAVGGAVALVGALVLVACMVVALGELLDNYWLSALIVGLGLILVGGIMAVSFIKRLKQIDLKPRETIQTLKEDRAWAEAEVSQVKRDLAG